MVSGRQRDHAKHVQVRRMATWSIVMKTMAHRRQFSSSLESNSRLLSLAVDNYTQSAIHYLLDLHRSQRISLYEFSFNFNAFSDRECLYQFRFTKREVLRLVNVIGWPEEISSTSRNGYAINPLLATCILLRRLATPARWHDLELLFGKHASHLSECFWEAVESFIELRGNLLNGPLSGEYIAQKAEFFASCIQEKCSVMDNCIGFIDGTVLGISRPSGCLLQNVAYDGHKRKHAVKYQAVVCPDGIILHSYGPLEGRRHDWTLYTRSGIEEQLLDCMIVNGKQYCIYGDSGYNQRTYREVPFQGSNLTPAQHAFNKAMSSVRVTVEWAFKEIKLYWTTVDFKRKLRVKQCPVAALYMAAMLLTNIRNIIHPNPISQFFRCPPPSLEEYLAHRGIPA